MKIFKVRQFVKFFYFDSPNDELKNKIKIGKSNIEKQSIGMHMDSLIIEFPAI